MNVKNVMFFENGCTVIFDESGKQVGDLQIPWFRLYMDYLKQKGVDLYNLEIQMPDGRNVKLIDVGDNDYNWKNL
jgi:hypothetical protein